MEHEFHPMRVLGGEGVIATCSCGWVSAYTHAFIKYAAPDHEFHVANTRRVTYPDIG